MTINYQVNRVVPPFHATVPNIVTIADALAHSPKSAPRCAGLSSILLATESQNLFAFMWEGLTVGQSSVSPRLPA